jgi:hypothetical protein
LYFFSYKTLMEKAGHFIQSKFYELTINKKDSSPLFKNLSINEKRRWFGRLRKDYIGFKNYRK